MTDAVASLRQAANTLRELGAKATDGPWAVDRNAAGESFVDAEYGPVAFTGSGRSAERDAAWIALLGPDNGPDLADWLEALASVWDSGGTLPAERTATLSFAERINKAAA